MSIEGKEAIFKEEKELLLQGFEAVIGIDEAGRGPLAGPVVAAAVALRKFQDTSNNNQTIFNNQIFNDQNLIEKLMLIKDSKKLSEKRREELYDFICENFYVGVGIVDHMTIDRINILEATYLAMRKAISSLNSKIQMSNDKSNPKPKIQNINRIILVDGNKEIPNVSIGQKAIIGGDKFVKSISAASIIAKVTRDRMMKEAHIAFPQYNFEKHKGYGTAEHIAAIRKCGPCEIHRKSFRPVKEAIEMYKMMISN